MPWIGCYTLDMYCDFCDENYAGSRYGIGGPAQYTDQKGSVCKKNAKEDGWKFLGDGRVMCPKCVKKRLQNMKGDNSK